MPAIEESRDWQGLDLYDADSDDKIGEITEIYLDRATGEAEWLAVKTGLLGTKVNFVPIASAVREGDRVKVPYSKDLVKDAPNACPGWEGPAARWRPRPPARRRPPEAGQVQRDHRGRQVGVWCA